MLNFHVSTDTLPYSIKILLESAVRNCDNFQVMKEDVEKILDWDNTAPKQVEIPFKPARVILQVSSISLKLSHFPPRFPSAQVYKTTVVSQMLQFMN